MKILYSGFIDPSHSAFGGYHNIINFPVDSKILLSENYPLGKIDKKYHLRKIPLWLLDFHTRILRKEYSITHLFYGEITMCPFIGYKKSKTHKTVITLHLDIEKQHLHSFFIKSLRNFDGIIVLSSQQQKYYKEKYNIDTTFIPHGFDTPKFSFKIAKDKNGLTLNPKIINLITCGKNYRDYVLLEKTIKHYSNNNQIHFHIVGAPSEVKIKLMNEHNVSVYDRLTDDEYYSLIQSCDYAFLPVTFATANNALLEAQALGIRSILPNISGILDYAAPRPLNLFYSSFDTLIGIIDDLNKTKPSQELIKYSMKFHWSNIFRELKQFYENL